MDSRKAKGIAADLAATSAEAVVETAADNLPLLASAIHDAGFQGAASILADGVVGAVAPGALGLAFGYRMRRTRAKLDYSDRQAVIRHRDRQRKIGLPRNNRSGQVHKRLIQGCVS